MGVLRLFFGFSSIEDVRHEPSNDTTQTETPTKTLSPKVFVWGVGNSSQKVFIPHYTLPNILHTTGERIWHIRVNCTRYGISRFN